MGNNGICFWTLSAKSPNWFVGKIEKVHIRTPVFLPLNFVPWSSWVNCPIENSGRGPMISTSKVADVLTDVPPKRLDDPSQSPEIGCGSIAIGWYTGLGPQNCWWLICCMPLDAPSSYSDRISCCENSALEPARAAWSSWRFPSQRLTCLPGDQGQCYSTNSSWLSQTGTDQMRTTGSKRYLFPRFIQCLIAWTQHQVVSRCIKYIKVQPTPICE